MLHPIAGIFSFNTLKSFSASNVVKDLIIIDELKKSPHRETYILKEGVNV